MCAKPGKTVYTTDGKRYTLITTYNNKHDHYKVITPKGRYKLIPKENIFAIF